MSPSFYLFALLSPQCLMILHCISSVPSDKLVIRSCEIIDLLGE